MENFRTTYIVSDDPDPRVIFDLSGRKKNKNKGIYVLYVRFVH